MLELLFTTLAILVFLIGFIYLFGTFKFINIFLYYCLIIFASIFVGIKSLYKKHILWNKDLITNTHTITFYAIIDLEPYYENEVFKSLNVIYDSNIIFSSINSFYYSNECLYNYFISNSECPITDIIIEDKQKDKYKNYTEIKIDDNKYLYYTKNKKDGKLYKYTKSEMNKDDLNFVSDFDYEKANRIQRLYEDRLNNPIVNFKNLVEYGDLLILIVILYYIFTIFVEKYENREFDFNKIFNITYELGILVYYIVRYTEFIKVKNYFFDNEEYYKDKSIYDNKETYYFPNKVFNLDSFPVSISINMLLIRLIYIIIPQNWHYYKDTVFSFRIDKDFIICFNIYYIIKSIILSFFFIFFISVLEYKFFKYNDNLWYNWNSNPIKSIELSPTQNYEFAKIKTKKKDYSFYEWRYHYFKIEKIKNIDYINIYKNTNGKICGKDSYGNNLYFPNDVECPINDIIIDKNNLNLTDYKEIQLETNLSLYYTNKNITKEIIIDLKANPENRMLNLN